MMDYIIFDITLIGLFACMFIAIHWLEQHLKEKRINMLYVVIVMFILYLLHALFYPERY